MSEQVAIPRMGPKSLERFGVHLDERLQEYFDGFVIVGTVRGSGQAVTLKASGMDDKTRICMATMLVGAVAMVQGQ